MYSASIEKLSRHFIPENFVITNWESLAGYFQLLNDKIGNDLFGIGFVGMVDQSNNQGLKANFISVSTAYNKSIDLEGYHKIGVGFQASWATKKADYSRFVFSRQVLYKYAPCSLPLCSFQIQYRYLALALSPFYKLS